ncbi:hypothetical protein ACFY1P_21775 [Streptomyces sp. NPDC001407]|uniref:hypothetical protein n=1 Tax=unclassified Streptomyces TaxID=2593676 RepID=UPI0036BB0A97
MANEELKTIEHALTQGMWAPSEEEIRLASALFVRRKRLEGELREQPSAAQSARERLLAQTIAECAGMARELTGEVLPLWRDRLSGSPMLRLVEMYADVCEETWRWENSPVPEDEAKAAEAILHRVGTIGTVIWAAGSGDISY